MLIHPDPIDAKPIEERIRGLICRQLALRVVPNDIDVTYGCLVSIARSGDEPTGAFEMFDIEIEAYCAYMDALNEGTDNDEIYELVLETLRSDYNLFLSQVETALAERVHGLLPEGLDKDQAYSGALRMARAIRLVSECDSDDDIMEMLSDEDIELGITGSLLSGARGLQHEFAASKMAMSMYEQGAEIAEVVAMMKQFL